jgi:hypothetical protein
MQMQTTLIILIFVFVNLDVWVPPPAIGESAHPFRPQIYTHPEAKEYQAKTLGQASKI